MLAEEAYIKINLIKLCLVFVISLAISVFLNFMVATPIASIFLSVLVLFTFHGVISFLFHFINSEIRRRTQIKFDHLMKFQAASFVFYLLSLFSSSFIEEEHQLWYFVELTQIIFIIIDYIRLLSNKQKENNLNKMISYLTTTLCVIRFLRSINQTGNKWQNQMDIGDFLREYLLN